MEIGAGPPEGLHPPWEEALDKGRVVSMVSLGVPCVLFRGCTIWSYPWSWVSSRARS